MAKSGSSKKIANSLMAASAAAVMAVYAAGYERTKDAASKLDAQFEQRRPVPSDVRPAGETSARALPPSANSDTAEAVPTHDRSSTQDQPSNDRFTNDRAALLSQSRERVAEKDTSAALPVQVASSSPAPSAVKPPVEPVAPISVQQKTDAPLVASLAPVPVTPAVAPPSPAPATDTTNTPAPADKPKYKDGTYTGWGSCRHGDIQAQITIEAGKITMARIAQCLTRYSCDLIGRLPPEVLQRQSAEVDWVSGATQSADAFYYAVSDALSKAK